MPARKPPKAPGRKAKLPARCSLNLSRHFPVWVKLWVTPPDPLFDSHYFEGKQNKNSRNPAISGVSWSCYPDLNWRPHPYQLTKGCYSLLLVIVPCRFQSLAPQGSPQILPAPCCFLPFLGKDCFLVSVSVLCRFLHRAAPFDLILTFALLRPLQNGAGPFFHALRPHT